MGLVALFNEALGIVGARAKLASEADQTREAEVCNIYYPQARRSASSAAFWPSLRKVADLALVSERLDPQIAWVEGDPLPPWQRAYALPADYLRARHLSNYARFDFFNRAAEQVLVTDVKPAVLVYTSRAIPPGDWESALWDLTVAELAQRMAMALSHDATVRAHVRDHWQRTYAFAITEQANAMEHVVPEWRPDWLGTRQMDPRATTLMTEEPYYLVPEVIRG